MQRWELTKSVTLSQNVTFASTCKPRPVLQIARNPFLALEKMGIQRAEGSHVQTKTEARTQRNCKRLGLTDTPAVVEPVVKETASVPKLKPMISHQTLKRVALGIGAGIAVMALAAVGVKVRGTKTGACTSDEWCTAPSCVGG